MNQEKKLPNPELSADSEEESKEWIARINRLNELELMIQTDSMKINIEWFRAMYSCRVPNSSWHSHTGTEIHYMAKGSIRILFDEEQILLPEGAAAVIPANLRHRLEEAAPEIPFYKIVINCRVEPLRDDREAILLEKILNGDHFKVIILDHSACRLLLLSVRESIHRNYGFLTVIKGNLISALMLLARQVSNSPSVDYEYPQKKNLIDERMTEIEKFIMEHIDTQITVEELAGHMNMSAKQIGRIIQTCKRQTANRFIMSLKMEKAKELLKNPEYSVGYISELLGFSSECYFNRYFKRQEGMPPGKYRYSVKVMDL